MDGLDLLQWPAMAVTVAAAALTGSLRPGRRKAGFWLFLSSNLLWAAWGWHSSAWALIVLQGALAALNLRGARRNERQEERQAAKDPAASAG